jgi:hypothetical protein
MIGAFCGNPPSLFPIGSGVPNKGAPIETQAYTISFCFDKPYFPPSHSSFNIYKVYKFPKE